MAAAIEPKYYSSLTHYTAATSVRGNKRSLILITLHCIIFFLPLQTPQTYKTISEGRENNGFYFQHYVQASPAFFQSYSVTQINNY